MAANHTFDDAAFFQYNEEVLNSEGFFVKSDYGHYVPGGIVRIGLEESDVLKQAEEAARFAVGKEDANLEFLKIVNLIKEPAAGAVYYITFEAKNSKNNEVNLYQTKVWKAINTGFRVQLFRPAKTCRNYE